MDLSECITYCLSLKPYLAFFTGSAQLLSPLGFKDTEGLLKDYSL